MEQLLYRLHSQSEAEWSSDLCTILLDVIKYAKRNVLLAISTTKSIFALINEVLMENY